MSDPPSTCWTIETLEACLAREVTAAALADCAPSRSAHAAMASAFRAMADEVVADLRVRGADPDGSVRPLA